MVRSLILLSFLLLPQCVFAQALPSEVVALQQKFLEEVDFIELDTDYKKTLTQQATKVILAQDKMLHKSSQYFLLTDRNPKMQTVSLAFMNGESNQITILGSGKTSTGNPKRIGFYETPVGVFVNTPSNMSYRALGTKNSKGWRGLGAKGSRVWDLGWQRTIHPKGGHIDIRLLVHATDPDEGERRLGVPDSKGCIRVSGRFNRFLDRYGILDAEYEQHERGKRIFQKERSPVSLAGNMVVVVDTYQ